MPKMARGSLALEGFAPGAFDDLLRYAEGIEIAKGIIFNLRKSPTFRTTPFFFNHHVMTY
jgi:hypothetical protein